MNEQILNELLGQMKAQTATLMLIAEALQSMSRPEAPDYRRPLEEYSQFDWASIGAETVSTDQSGPAILRWGGYEWKRRASSHAKFGKAIWFSRPVGKDEDGNTDYYCLIKFSDKTAGPEDLPGDIARQLPKKPVNQPQPPPEATGNGSLPPHWSKKQINRQRMETELSKRSISLAMFFEACGVRHWDGMLRYEGTGSDALQAAIELHSRKLATDETGWFDRMEAEEAARSGAHDTHN